VGKSDKKPIEGEVNKVFRLMLPALFGVSVAQINMLINTLLASFLVTGSVSWLYYSDRLMEFPLGVFGIALATVILPTLSKQQADTSSSLFSDTLDWALRWVLLIVLPASVALMVLAGPLLTTIFQYGAFTPTDVTMASQSLVAFALGLIAFVVIKVLAPGFYARQDTRTPVRYAAIAMGVNAVLSLLLVWEFAHVGLALATSVAALVNAALLFFGLYRRGIYQPLPGWWSLLLKVAVASLVMGLVLWSGAGDTLSWIESSLLHRLGWLSWLIVVGLGVYMVSLLSLGVKPWKMMLVEKIGEEGD
jgi:putative peptidoglycan lipid II flippase